MAATASDMAKLVRIICAIALLCVGFSHKTPVIESVIPLSEVASYTLPDGTLPVLCLPTQDDNGKHHSHDLGTGCEACRITASIVLPTPADSIGQAIVVATEIHIPIRREAFYRQLFPPNASPRGPPTGTIA
ncbi:MULTISPECIES: hypothetical protein [Rhizobium/Agrobacterium group]|uniref:DUF2946 domain-containing protein n=2 Tax=Rhizobium/Agrobacterium group TaxID=227290 RepID=B9K5R6_ALLAM|nr:MULTISPECIES: hypothetical protein [Rhizobium/Agrobacterium group]ACM40214.1 conserved hypothetical protein [Allorhizobium ampelinum S4]MUO28314.1 hypothetical protein [Agrobacterium vitis]MUO41196.1 hypothetical protein [Agrobacterium vitis]MUP08800.1 hypothetical protein [Agrobacterium vitis]